MLKQRLITAAILIPLVIWAIFGLPTATLALIFAAIVAVGALEWGNLLKLPLPLRLVYVGAIAALLAALDGDASRFAAWLTPLLVVAALWWLVATAWVLRYPGGEGVGRKDTVLGSVIGVAVLIPCWLALVYLHGDKGPWWLLFLMFLIWTADSGAYFAGRRWGKHKLAPRVSPGKTLEGVGGALVATVVVASIGGGLLGLAAAQLYWFVPLCLITVLVSIVGDLLESLFKRRAGMKDSGRILPGHGGVLDRIDSMTAAAPVFALGLHLFGMAQ